MERSKDEYVSKTVKNLFIHRNPIRYIYNPVQQKAIDWKISEMVAADDIKVS